jgi:ABC-type uncharacterized transport system substrate-binding protein
MLLMVWGNEQAVAEARLQVLIVGGSNTPSHKEVVDSLRNALGEAENRRFDLRLLASGDYTHSLATDHGLVLTVGTEAAAVVLRDPPAAPVYCTFLPEAAYAVLSARTQEAQRSALYIDQPYSRRMRLIRFALPNKNRIGVVLGPESRREEKMLRLAASAEGFRLNIETIAEERQLVGAVHHAMDESDILLAVPDSVVFNRNTAQSVLLTTYRLGKPVSGYSRAYVTAGALFSVYSTPAQIGRQLGEELLAMQSRPGKTLPPPGYPRFFSVEINERVAHSLGLEPGSAQDLTRQLTDISAGTSHE